MYGALADAILAAETDPAIRVIVLRGEGDMYTAGNDVGEFAMMATGQFRGERHVSRFIDSIARSTKPMVAAVQGRAVGIGATMLLHCDFVVLAENALLSTPFVGLALVPEAASSLLLPLRIGYARAYEMFALGETLDAKAALALRRRQPRCAAGETACRSGRGRRSAREAAGGLARRDQAADAQCRDAAGADGGGKQNLRRTADHIGGARGLHRLCREAAAGLHETGWLNCICSEARGLVPLSVSAMLSP